MIAIYQKEAGMAHEREDLKDAQRRGYGMQIWPDELQLGADCFTPWEHIRGTIRWKDDDKVWIAARDGREYVIPYELVNPQPHFYRTHYSALDLIDQGRVTSLRVHLADEGRGILLTGDDGLILNEAEVQELLGTALAHLQKIGPAPVIKNNWTAWLERNPPPPAQPMPKYGSMRPGVVYLLRADNGYHKIGRAKCLTPRVTQIGIQVPMHIELAYHFEADDCVLAEAHLHERFAAKRVKGEWFDLSPEEVEWICGIARWVHRRLLRND
jgi:hypothetical protein